MRIQLLVCALCTNSSEYIYTKTTISTTIQTNEHCTIKKKKTKKRTMYKAWYVYWLVHHCVYKKNCMILQQHTTQGTITFFKKKQNLFFFSVYRQSSRKLRIGNISFCLYYSEEHMKVSCSLYLCCYFSLAACVKRNEADSFYFSNNIVIRCVQLQLCPSWSNQFQFFSEIRK